MREEEHRQIQEEVSSI